MNPRDIQRGDFIEYKHSTNNGLYKGEVVSIESDIFRINLTMENWRAVGEDAGYSNWRVAYVLIYDVKLLYDSLKVCDCTDINHDENCPDGEKKK
jgi:hypothetical protein